MENLSFEEGERKKRRNSAERQNSFFLARQEGLEPPTFWFVAKHSIQLSYQRICNLLTARV